MRFFGCSIVLLCKLVTFKYDPFGRRIYKSPSSGTSIYAYDGINLIEETNSGGAVVSGRGNSSGLTIKGMITMLFPNLCE